MQIRVRVQEVYAKDQEGVPRKFKKGNILKVIVKMGNAYFARLNKTDIHTYIFFEGEVEEVSLTDLTEMKMRVLMIIIEKLIARHHSGKVSLDEPSFQLFEFAKRFYFVEGEKAFQIILAELVSFNK